LKNPSELFHAKSIQRRYHRQPSDHLRDQPEGFQVFRLHLPQQPISSHLAVFRHLTEAETTPPEPLGDNVFQPNEGPAADEQDVGRVEGNARLLRMLEATLRGTVAIVPSKSLSKPCWTPPDPLVVQPHE